MKIRVLPDFVDEAGPLEVLPQVLFDPRHREDDAAVLDLLSQRFEGVDGGEVELTLASELSRNHLTGVGEESIAASARSVKSWALAKNSGES